MNICYCTLFYNRYFLFAKDLLYITTFSKSPINIIMYICFTLSIIVLTNRKINLYTIISLFFQFFNPSVFFNINVYLKNIDFIPNSKRINPPNRLALLPIIFPNFLPNVVPIYDKAKATTEMQITAVIISL